MSEVEYEESVFDRALDAASAAFKACIDEHFGRTYDGSPVDAERVLEEYRAGLQHLRPGIRLSLRTGLVDADFECWLSEFADENCAPSTPAPAPDDAEGKG